MTRIDKLRKMSFVGDVIILVIAVINPLVHYYLMPLDNSLECLFVSDVWVFLLALTCLFRSPYLNRHKTFEEWVQDYKNVR